MQLRRVEAVFLCQPSGQPSVVDGLLSCSLDCPFVLDLVLSRDRLPVYLFLLERHGAKILGSCFRQRG